jgi:hypothetical protein
MDALRLADEIRVEGAKDNASMPFGAAPMKTEKVPAILGQQNSTLGRRERQNPFI